MKDKILNLPIKQNAVKKDLKFEPWMHQTCPPKDWQLEIMLCFKSFMLVPYVLKISSWYKAYSRWNKLVPST